MGTWPVTAVQPLAFTVAAAAATDWDLPPGTVQVDSELSLAAQPNRTPRRNSVEVPVARRNRMQGLHRSVGVIAKVLGKDRPLGSPYRRTSGDSPPREARMLESPCPPAA